MDAQIYNNLAGAINSRFPDKLQFWVVHQTHEGIFLTEWNASEMGEPLPDEGTMLLWIQEFEALSDYERMSQIGQDIEDVTQGLLSIPLVQALLVATPVQIDTQVDAADLQRLKNIIKILILAVRMLIRDHLS